MHPPRIVVEKYRNLIKLLKNHKRSGKPIPAHKIKWIFDTKMSRVRGQRASYTMLDELGENFVPDDYDRFDGFGASSSGDSHYHTDARRILTRDSFFGFFFTDDVVNRLFCDIYDVLFDNPKWKTHTQIMDSQAVCKLLTSIESIINLRKAIGDC